MFNDLGGWSLAVDKYMREYELTCLFHSTINDLLLNLP